MKVLFVIVGVCLLGAFTCWKSVASASGTDDLFLKNVEALAEEEWYDGNCWWVERYTECDPKGKFEGCPCGSHG